MSNSKAQPHNHDRAALAVASALLADSIGLDTGALGMALLAQVLEQRRQDIVAKQLAELSSLPDYLDYLRANADEQARLIQAVLVTESWFERDSAQLDAFSRTLPSVIAAVAGQRRIKVLCAPCSHGEEPFSLAARLWEHGLNADNAEVLALDLSERALAKARQANYTDSAWRSNLLLPWWLTRSSGGLIKVDARLQSMVRFSAANLLHAEDFLPPGPFDAVFSRNFLIYLTPTARELWLGRIATRLAPHGLVYSGPAESFHHWSRNYTAAPDSGHPYVYAWVKSTSPAPVLVQPGAPVAKPLPPVKPLAVKQTAAVAAQTPKQPTQSTPLHDLQQQRAQIRQLADSGQFIEASSQLDATLEAHAAEADDFLLMALIALAQGNRQAAETALERALFLEPRHAEALEHLAGLREMAGRSSEAQQLRKRIDRLGSRKLASAASTAQVDA